MATSFPVPIAIPASASASGQHAGVHGVQSELMADGLGVDLRVPCDHHDMHAVTMKLGERLWRCLLDRVGDRDRTCNRTGGTDDDDRCTVTT